ncbi:MAG: polysaccharide biosynthesis/export family protein [Kiritimatiellae bacterium]|nr:polysaccharide biosynthesis/export family protein [Kiritimatiellia bacterium]
MTSFDRFLQMPLRGAWMVAAVALAAASLGLQGCSTSRGRTADADGSDWNSESYDGMLPTPEEGQSVHEAAEAARANRETAAQVKGIESMPVAAPVAQPVEPVAQPAAPAPQPAAPVAQPPAAPAPQPAAPATPAEALGLTAAEMAELSALSNGDGEQSSSPANAQNAASAGNGVVFTDDEEISEGNRFDPIIGRGYRLKVLVRVGDRDEVGPLDVMVSEKGEISLPLAGRVMCEGLTINGLHSRLSGIYSEFFTDPDVDVHFAYSDDGISPYGQVLVQGRVHREGWVNIPPTRNLRLSHAIQRCGGFASSALRRKVFVLRRKDGKIERHVIDFKAIGKNGELENDILLEPNDVIFVDESSF